MLKSNTTEKKNPKQIVVYRVDGTGGVAYTVPWGRVFVGQIVGGATGGIAINGQVVPSVNLSNLTLLEGTQVADAGVGYTILGVEDDA